MSDASELWSIPWHALQRRLAKRVAAEAASAAFYSPTGSPAEFVAAGGGNWIGRASAPQLTADRPL